MLTRRTGKSCGSIFTAPNAILHRLEQAQIPAEVFPLDWAVQGRTPHFH